MPTRKLDPRKRQTRYAQNATRLVRSSGQPLAATILAINTPRTFQSVDSVGGEVIVVANVSDIPAHRASAARILGGEVTTVLATSAGTIWKAV